MENQKIDIPAGEKAKKNPGRKEIRSEKKISGPFSLPRVIFYYFILSLIVTFPLVLYLKSTIIGDFAGDMWKHIWGFWWIKDNLINYHTFPNKTELLNYPYGGAIFFIDSLGAILSIPLQFIFGLTASYNLMILFNLTLGGVGMFLLARYLSKNVVAAFIAGVIFAFSSFTMTQIESGVTEVLNIGWVPLYILYFIKTMKERSLLNPVLAALFLFLSTFGSWYFGIFNILFTVIFLLYFLIKSFLKNLSEKKITVRKVIETAAHTLYLLVLLRVITHPPQQIIYYLLGLLAYPLAFLYLKKEGGLDFIKQPQVQRAVILITVSFLLLFPVTYYFKVSLSSPDALVIRNRTEESLQFYLNNPFNVSKVIDYIMPGKGWSTVSLTVDRLTKVSYAGIIALALGIIGIFQYRRRYMWVFLAGSVTFFLLSLGPFVCLIQPHPDIRLKNIFYLALFKLLPFFSEVAIPYRFFMMFMLCLAVLAAFGLAKLLRGKPGYIQNTVAVLITAGILLDLMLVSPLPFPLSLSKPRISNFYKEQGAIKKPYGLIDFPIQRQTGMLLPGEYFYYQIYHQKGIPNKVEGTIPVYVYENLLTLYMFNLEKKFDLQLEKVAYAPPAKELKSAAADLKEKKFKYLVLHLDYYPGEVLPPIRAFLTYFFGAPRSYPPDLEVYQVY
ncbi:MAG: hypothetical protein M1269_00500 [Chloroflexi bacterium]|nr:hypothetical protein [Chloroflexota bacterium]